MFNWSPGRPQRCAGESHSRFPLDFIYFTPHPHAPSIGPPVIVFVSAFSSAGLRNRVGDSPCLQTVRISFRNASNLAFSIIYLFLRGWLDASASEGQVLAYPIIYLFIYQPVAQSARSSTGMHDRVYYLCIYLSARGPVGASIDRYA